MADKKSTNSLSYVLNMFAILTFLVLIAIYWGLGLLPISWLVFKELGQSLISDICAVLVVFLVVSFFLDRKGLSPSNIFKEELLSEILKRYPTTKSFLNASEANAQFDLVEKLKSAKKVYLTGWSFILVQKISSNIVESLLNGTDINILVTEPQSSATGLFSVHQIDNKIEADLELFNTVISNIRKEIIDKKRSENLGTLTIRYATWISSCNLMIINPQLDDGILRVMVYPLSIKTNHSTIQTYQVIRKKEDPVVFTYFQNEFNTLWEKDSISESDFLNKRTLKLNNFDENNIYTKNLTSYGVIGYYNNKPIDTLLEKFKSATKSIQILHTWLESSQPIPEEVFIAANNGAKVTIILLNPESEIAKKRTEELGFDFHSQRPIVLFEGVVNAIKKQKEAINNINLLTIDSMPPFAIYAADSSVIMGFYWTGRGSVPSPHLELEDKPNGIVALVKETFQHLEKQGTIIKLT